ncbi:MAG: hypothetical protein QW184_00270 [Nanopusillaceae archaeon]
MITIEELLKEQQIEEDGEIVKVEVKKAAEIFGNRARQPERQVMILHTRTKSGVEGRETHPLPKGIVYDESKNDFVVENKLSALRSLRNPNSWFRRFLETYKSTPKPGTKVKLTLNQRGFLAIKL